MEEAIKSLQEKLDIFEHEEINDIVSLAIDIIVNTLANGDSKLSDLSRKMANNKDYESVKKQSIREAIDMSSRKSVVENLNKYSPTLYSVCLNQVKNDNLKRTHTISVLLELIERLTTPFKDEILEFPSLKSILSSVALNPQHQIFIFTYIIKNNARLHSIYKKHACIPNIVELINHKYKYITIEEVAKLLVDRSLEEFFSDENPKNPQGQKELQDHFEATCIDCTETQESCQKLSAIFSKNIWDLKEEDYQEIISLMRYLSIEDLANRIIKQIKREAKEYPCISELQKLIGITSYDVIFHESILPKVKVNNPKKEIKEEHIEEIEPKHSQREINQVHYEISKFFDLDTFKPKTTLSLDEIIYLLSLMYSIDFKETTIMKFLTSAMHAYYKNNPFCIFYQSYDKFKSFANPDLKEHVDMIEYILSDNNIFICSEDEYQETKELVSIELNAIIDIIAGNYDYEKNKAKELLKNQEEK